MRALPAHPAGAVRRRRGARLHAASTRSSRRHGSGRGCDVCKPAVASILASQLNGHVLDGANRHAAGHQRRLPRQHPAQRHLLGRPAHPRRRDHPGEADRDRRGRPRLRALHEDHRRPADRPVRRPDGAAAGDLAAAGRRRLRVRPRLRQGAADGEVLRRLDLVPLRRAGLGPAWRSTWSCATGGCARRTSSRAASAAAPASAPRPAARTSASSPPRRAGTSTSAATAARPRRTPGCSPATSTPRRWSATSTGSSCTTSAPPTGCSAPRPGSTRSTAAWTGSARWWSTTRSASAPSWRRRWRGTSTRYFDEWKATLDDPEKLARFVSFVNAPDSRPEHHLPGRARPGQRRPTPTARSARHDDPGRGAAMTASGVDQPATHTTGLPARRHRGRGRRGRAGATAHAVAIFRTHDGNVYAISNYDPLLQRLGAGPRHRRHPRGRPRSWPRRCTSRRSTCAPDSASTTRRSGCRRTTSRWPTAIVLVGLREGRVRDRGAPDPWPASGSGSPPRGRSTSRWTLLERRGAAVEWAPALSMDPNQVDDAELRAATRRCWPAGRHVPGDHRHRHEGVVRRGRGVGHAPTSCWPPRRRRDPRPRPEERRCAAPRGLRELWAPESECFEDVLAHLRGRDLDRAADRRAGARPVAVDGGPRAAPAAGRT